MKKLVLLMMLTLMAISASCSLAASSLTTAERDGLLYMREEEKLARDVYLTLYDKWHAPIFANIAASEQVHMDRVLGLLSAYGVDDPAAGKGLGEFTNPSVAALYQELTDEGANSLQDALRVGVSIEQTDIADLSLYLAQTNRRNIQNVYTNLRAASYNHLRAFTSLLR